MYVDQNRMGLQDGRCVACRRTRCDARRDKGLKLSPGRANDLASPVCVALMSSKTVYETVADGAEQIELGKRVVSSRAYLGWFNFKGADQQ